MKICILNDAHYGCRNNNEFFLENQLEFFEKQLFPYLKKHGIKDVIHAGDVFDQRKNINVKTLETVKSRVFDPLREMGISVTVLVGNHDSFFKDSNRINTPRILLNEYDNWTVIDTACEERGYYGGKCTIGLMPWITNDNYDASIEFLKTADVDVLIGHFEIMGFDLHPGQPALHGMDVALFERFPLVLSGHYHTKSKQKNIHYLGAQYEMTWVDCDDPKGFHVLDCATKKIEFIPNENRMFYRITVDFDTKEKVAIPQTLKNKYVKLVVKGKADKKKLEAYTQSIMLQEPADFKVVENEHNYLTEDIDIGGEVDVEDTLSLMNVYVDSLDLGENVNKKRVKKHLSSLHTEALEIG